LATFIEQQNTNEVVASPSMSSTYIDSDSGLEAVINAFSRYNTFAFDIESSGLNPIDSRMLLAQISFPGDESYVINAGLDLTPLMPFFADHKWLKIIQNAKFDTKFLLHYYNTKTSNIFDTQIAEQLILSEPGYSSASLKALALKYLGITLNKDIRQSFIDMKPNQMFTDEQLDYASEDADVLFGIMKAQQEKLTEYGLDKVAAVEFELAPVVGAMELTGVPVDVQKWKNIIEVYRGKHEDSRLKMHEELFDSGKIDEQLGLFVRDAINLNSPKQIKDAFLKIGIDIDKTDERTISLVNHPAAKELLNYRGLQKIMTSYGASFLDKIHPFTGRIHANYQQMGTATGRFACKDPNLQQMPDEFRQCVSEPGYMMVVADYANIELRILAELSKDEALSSAFISGEDPHTSTASLMFNIPLETVTKEQRFIAKTINFGISYGMGPNKLMDMLNKGKTGKEVLGFQRVNGMMKRYKETYHRANQWLLEAGNLAYRRSYSETMMGRRRWFERPDNSEPDWEGQVASIKRQGANSPIQGTNADITKLAMLNLYHDLRTYGYKGDIILQVHDEIGVLAHKSQAEAIKEIVETSMVESAQVLLKKIPVKVDCYINEVWKK